MLDSIIKNISSDIKQYLNFSNMDNMKENERNILAKLIKEEKIFGILLPLISENNLEEKNNWEKAKEKLRTLLKEHNSIIEIIGGDKPDISINYLDKTYGLELTSISASLKTNGGALQKIHDDKVKKICSKIQDIFAKYINDKTINISSKNFTKISMDINTLKINQEKYDKVIDVSDLLMEISDLVNKEKELLKDLRMTVSFNKYEDTKNTSNYIVLYGYWMNRKNSTISKEDYWTNLKETIECKNSKSKNYDKKDSMNLLIEAPYPVITLKHTSDIISNITENDFDKIYLWNSLADDILIVKI